MVKDTKEPITKSTDKTHSAPKRLVRLPKNGKIAGVCAGLADYLEIDVTGMRIVFVILTLASGGFGILVYITLAIIMPVGEATNESRLMASSIGENMNQLVEEVRVNGGVSRLRIYLGLSLIVFGAWLLLVRFFPDWIRFDWDYIWPAFLVLIGIVLVMRSRK